MSTTSTGSATPSTPASALDGNAAAAGCPDDNRCAFACKTACFRVLSLAPDKGVYPGDVWPEAIRAAHTDTAVSARDAQVARRETESLGLLNEMVGRYRRAQQSLILTQAGSDLHASSLATIEELGGRRFIVKVDCSLHCGRKIDHEVTVADYATNPTHPRTTCGQH